MFELGDILLLIGKKTRQNNIPIQKYSDNAMVTTVVVGKKNIHTSRSLHDP